MLILLNLFLTISVINLLCNILFKKKSNILCCGIYGFSGKKHITKQDLRVALQKFKILGLYNEHRGKDSCGIKINQNLKKGVGPEKLISTFISNNVLSASLDDKIFMGHNRQASPGSRVTEENQHPFLIGEDMWITHNGTLREPYIFCEQYKLNYQKIDVDTIMLGEAIFANNIKDVLEFYKGTVAMVLNYQSKKNTIYLYHGASKQYKMGVVEEERPLFYLIAKEGLYYSSTKESLEAIREDESEEVISLPTNTVFEVVYGEFTENTIKIDREERNAEYPKVNAYSTKNYHHHGYAGGIGYGSFGGCSDTKRLPPAKKFPTIATFSNSKLKPILSILRESLPTRVITEKDAKYLIYYQGRHYVNNYGSLDLAKGVITVTKKKAYLVEDSEITKENAASYITLFFWEGYLMENQTKYEAWLTKYSSFSKDVLNRMVFAKELSYYTKYPTTNRTDEGVKSYQWYEKGVAFKEAFTPFSSGRSYKMDNYGYLINIVSSHATEITYFTNVYDAEKEFQEYKNGTLTNDENPPSLFDIFEPGLFWNIYLTNNNLTVLGEYEREALERYLRLVYEEGSPFTPSNEEIIQATEVFIDEVIANRSTIATEIVADEHPFGVAKLKELYEDILASDLDIDNEIDFNHLSSSIDSISEELTYLRNNLIVLENLEEVKSYKDHLNDVYHSLITLQSQCKKSEILSKQPGYTKLMECLSKFEKQKNLNNGVI